MRAARLLIGLALFALLAGCTQSEVQQGAEPPQKSPPPQVEVPPSPAVESAEDAEIDTLLQEIQALEEFLSDVESGDTLDVSL
ncbi:MAG: hypothetical protein GXO66_04470 [Euryarchaeota archaeon]|nr:hypothetical protein [Euryarchaeota archaeon]